MNVNRDMLIKLTTLMIRHEGFRQYPYIDTLDKITIGIGRNLSDRGLECSEVDLLFQNDVNYFYQRLLSEFPWFSLLNQARQIALIDMCFMGFQHFLTFHDMIAALEKQDFVNAAKCIIDSKYEKEVGHRAREIAEIIETGEIKL